MTTTSTWHRFGTLRLSRPWRSGVPWWVWVLTAYAISRLATALVLWQVAQEQVANLDNDEPANPGLDRYLAYSWDGGWYENIARDGYPDELPINPRTGRVAANEWAFYPLFPMLCRGLMALTGQPWHHVAPALSTVLGGAAMLVIYQVITRGAWRLGTQVPLRTIVLLVVFPSAVVLQAAYTEALALLLLALGLACIITWRHLAAIAPVTALGFTRAVALPLAAVVAWQAVADYRERGRSGVTQRPGFSRWHTAVLLAVTVATSFAWPLITGWATGRADAYFATQSAWRAGISTSQPFLAWTTRAQLVPGGLVILALGVLAFVAFLLAPMTRRLGPELWAWTAAYPLYLLAVGSPTTSLVRFALLAFPALGVVAAVARRRVPFVLVVLALVVMSVAWMYLVWRWTPTSGEIVP